MPSYQQMIQNMQKVQREMEKKQRQLDEKEFEYTANGAVKVVLKGNMELVSIDFLDEDMLNKDDADILKDMIKLAYNGCKKLIEEANEELENSFKAKAGMPGMF